MDRKVFLLFVIFLSHAPSLLSSEDPGCWSRCRSRVSKWKCCARLMLWCRKQEAEPEQPVQEAPKDITQIEESPSGYKYVDPNADDKDEADTAGYVEIEQAPIDHDKSESIPHSPRTSTTGTVRLQSQDHPELPSFSQLPSQPDSPPTKPKRPSRSVLRSSILAPNSSDDEDETSSTSDVEFHLDDES